MALCARPGPVEAAEPPPLPAAATSGVLGVGAADPGPPLYDLGPIEGRRPELSALVAAARAGRTARVLALSSRLTGAAQDGEVRSAALYLRARALERARRPGAASRTWARLARGGPLADLARLRLADLALERGRREAALGALEGLSPDHPRRAASWLQMAEIELDRGRVEAARAILARVDPRGLRSSERSKRLLLTGDVQRRLGRLEAAAETYRRLWRTGRGVWAEQGLERLAASGHPPGPVDRMERLLAHVPRRWPRGRRGRRARRDVRARIDRLGSDTPGLAAYGHGLLLARRRSQRERAIASLDRALRAARDPELIAHVRYHLGDLQGKLGRDEAAIATLEPVLVDPPDPRLEARVLWRLVRLYNARGRLLDVDRVLARLLADEGDPARRDEARWALAWRRFRVGDCPEALRLLAELDRPGATFNHGRQSWRARSRYWQARCHARTGRLDRAVSLWLSVIAAHPMTWYGALSLDRIRETRPDLARRLRGPVPPEGSAEELALDKLRVGRQPALDGPVLLIQLRELREASRMLRERLRAGLSSDGVHLLAALYHLRGRDRAAFAVLQRYTRVAARPDESTVGAWRQAFPTPFAEDFERAAAEAGIPRSWLYAIARHESAFIPTARSPVGALGLVQLMPRAAARVASLYGLKVSRRSLRRPAYNLAVGARYLSELSRMYADNLALASAAYNAGPYAVRGWLKREGVVPTDVFVESIPYPQARRYAMRVCATAQSYAWLYPQWRELAVLSTSRPAMVPSRLGPFMQGPGAGTSSRAWPPRSPPVSRRVAGF